MFSFLRKIPRPSDVRNALAGVVDPHRVKSIQVTPEGKVIVTLEVSPDEVAHFEPMRSRAEEVVDRMRGVKKSLVIMTSERKGPSEHTGPIKTSSAKNAPLDLSKIGKIIAVASGKGGVGKSTIAVNLALALAATGKNIGLLDADIYGPSVPRLMGIQNQKPETDESGRIVPLTAHGIKLMSMGFMVDESTPMIWRGPIVQSALLQMLRDVNWDGLDILVIDLPPGTGDIHLTLAQKVPLSGAVIVSTPQDIALIDARKGLEMFRKVSVPVLGIVENMSYYCCSNCGHRDDIFGHGGARQESENLNIPFLGEIPLHAKIREFSDSGTPIVIAEPTSEQSKIFSSIAQQILTGLA